MECRALHQPSPPKQEMASTNYDQDQQLFADTLLKLQINSALAKENTLNQKSPLPYLAECCSLLDNLPRRPLHWTPAQENLVSALKIDAWVALADGFIQAKELIQAESSLQKLSLLQDAAAGPLSLRSKKAGRQNKRYSSHNQNESGSISPSVVPTSSSPSSSATPEVSEGQLRAAADLMRTWVKLRQVYIDMGKQDMVNNFSKRIGKMEERIESLSTEPLK
ncbi:hypothetical protein EDD21DRAFT_371731 [Dissophora ornata]|nr:hypothetical protein EDD21DRAFT_371731 [Dissophora ornata]